MPVELELASFAQNLVTLESLLFRTNRELSAPEVNLGRIAVYQSEMQSIKGELIVQQRRVIDEFGLEDPRVVRLQGLLAGPVKEIISKTELFVEEAEAKLHELTIRMASSSGAPPLPPVDSHAPQGDDGEMDARITKLEADLTTIKIDIGVIKANGATKSDIADLRGATKSDIADLRGAIKADVADLKTTIEGVKTTVAEAKTAMIMWAVGAILVGQLLPAIKEFLLPPQRTPPIVQAPASVARPSTSVPTKP